MIAAMVASLLVRLLLATGLCPPMFWINGVAPDGSYECLRTLGDNDSPAIARTRGRLRCDPDEQPLVIDSTRASCVRRRRTAKRYRTPRLVRHRAMIRRDRRRDLGLCLNADDHGPATHGVLCATCREKHRKSS